MKEQISRRRVLRSAAIVASAAASSWGRAENATEEIRLAGQPVEVQLIPFSSETMRLRIRRLQGGVADEIHDDGAPVNPLQGKPAITLRRLGAKRTVKCGDLHVSLSPNPLTFRVETKKGRLVQELKCDATNGSLSFELGDGPVLGLGQGGQQFDRRGSVDKMGSGQGAFHLGTHGARVPIQLAVGASGWAIYIHRPLGTFDLTSNQGVFQPDADGALPLDVFVIGSNDAESIMTEYAKITGFPEMVPLWSFGYQQSHRTLGPPEEILAEAKLFREKKLPCDAMIYLGSGFCPNGWNTDNGEFSWNNKAFPNPAQAIQDLQKDHFKVVLHVVLEGHKLTGSVSDACTAQPLPSGRTADKHWPPDRQVSCYWPVHKQLLDVGIDGWWPDQGDGLDAPSRLARNRMYFEGTQMYRPNQRVYALHRNAYAGMQRFGAFLWSGDVLSRWETLKTHVSVGINAGLSGIPYWGTDIGGFIPTEEYTGELFARWFQFATFNPLFRSHGRDWRLHLPWGWTLGEIGYPETASYHPEPADLHNPSIEPICKKYLELRYQMLPYIYSAAKETCETGLPMIRALWLHYQDDARAVARGDEYLFGRDLLVAPVVEKGATARSLYLPKGDWYDFWTKEKMPGGREISRKVELETTPLYLRAGTILPLGPIKQYSGERVDEPTRLHVFPGVDGRFVLYEDDGNTFDFRKGQYQKISMEWRDRDRRLSVRLVNGSKMPLGAKRVFAVEIVGESAKKDLVFDGRPTTIEL